MLYLAVYEWVATQLLDPVKSGASVFFTIPGEDLVVLI